MKISVKILSPLLRDIRVDLHRHHPFACERVGFINAGATRIGDDLMLVVRDYQPVADGDYERSMAVGAQIGPDAIRKALEAAYKRKSCILHVHTHGGRGRPEFSPTDLKSAASFVPGFFNALPEMPHGIIVLSNDSARGLIWTAPKKRPTYVAGFVEIGAQLQRIGEAP